MEEVIVDFIYLDESWVSMQAEPVNFDLELFENKNEYN